MVPISELNFDGAQPLTVSDQQQIITSVKQRTYVGDADGVMSEVLERVRAAWQDRGYFRVEIEGEGNTTAANPGLSKAALLIHVNEGHQYRLRDITFKAHTAISNLNFLRNLFPMEDGDIFSREKVAQGLDALRDTYREMGYINFAAVPDANLDEKNSQVSLEIDMDEGKQFYITKINLIGSDQQTLEKASQNLLMHPGDLFNERLLERFSQNILRS